MNTIFKIISLWITGVFVLLTFGCTVTTRTISPDEQLHYDEAYDFSDKKVIVNTLVESLLSKPPIAKTKVRPVLIVYKINNKTSEHIDTEAISDDIRQALLESGKVRLISQEQRKKIEAELKHQNSGLVSASSRIKKASQIGARYIITGKLHSIEKEEARQIRIKKKSLKYYNLNLELTDIQTGILEWADKVEIIREASKPFIGW